MSKCFLLKESWKNFYCFSWGPNQHEWMISDFCWWKFTMICQSREKRDKRLRKTERKCTKQVKYVRNRKEEEQNETEGNYKTIKANGIKKNRKNIASLFWIPNWQFCSFFKVKWERIWESFPLTSLSGCFGNRVKEGWGKSRGGNKYFSV